MYFYHIYSSSSVMFRFELGIVIWVRDIGSGNFGVARLMKDKQTKELVAVKYMERGDKVSFVIIISYNNSFTSLMLL